MLLQSSLRSNTVLFRSVYKQGESLARLSKGYGASLLNTAFVLFDVKGSDIYGWLYEYREKFILQDFVCSDSNLSLALG